MNVPAGTFWWDVGTLRTVGWTLVHSLWIGGVLAALLRLGLRLLPPASAHLRHRAATACLLLLTIATVGIGASLLGEWREHAGCWRQVERIPSASDRPLPPRCTPHVGKTVMASVRAASRSAAGPGVRAEPAAAPARAGAVGEERRPPAFERVLARGTRLLGLHRVGTRLRPSAIAASRTLQVAVGLWALFAAASLLRFLIGFLALGRTVRRAALLEDAGIRRTVARLASRTGVGRAVEVRAVPGLESPGVVGWRRPVLLLPEELHRTAPRDELTPIIAHELLHVRRADYPADLVQRLVDILFCFNPFGRWISNRVRLEREAARDREVVRSGVTSARGYVRALAAAEIRGGAGRAGAGRVPSCAFHHGRGELLERVRRLAPKVGGGGGNASAVRAGRGALGRTLGLAGAVLIGLLTGVLAYEAASVSSFAVMAVDNEARPSAARIPAAAPVPRPPRP